MHVSGSLAKYLTSKFGVANHSPATRNYKLTPIQKELSLPANQLLALFNRSMRKFSEHFRGLLEKAIEKSMAPVRAVELEPNDQSLESAMSEAAREAQKELKV